ncbi:HAMP domain-containing sensor histidine kinase [Luteipulveratus sp. YIM 133132]|uniref:sensor histidine kinase n=1 Tax=Luteipulveratus flavus TaxID=3031728 RepID=UPI0023B1BC92|nr:HAMP domain-containing sensor histidine kinase [Luteipulveratus sp. YIM 133132]MDE9367005.1 HAMP domain-containing sensor histidine kinase [Luteipulveratus sp. YIM 133132]
MNLRERLVRANLATAFLAVLIVAAPTVIAIAVGVAVLHGLRESVVTIAVLLGLVILLSLIALGAAAVLARRHADAVAHPMTQLADRAEDLGARRPKFEPLTTDIAEIDKVSRVLQRRASDLARQLANERDFASDASHQLRTPLTALLIRLEEISLSDDPELMREEAHICIDQVERLTRVIDDLLRRSRATPDDQVPAVSLDAVLASLQLEWLPAFQQARRSVKVSGQRDLHVLASPDHLAQIISTLLENSLKHGGGRVEVNARRSGPSVVVEVTDEGKGIDPAIAAHIFERQVTTGGTGLGLALARDLAQSNGGRLELLGIHPPQFALFLSEVPGAH